MTRRCVVGFVIIFLLPLYALSQQWIRQESGTTANLHGVWFVDSLNGWACGDSGIILHTTNAGIDWATQNSTVSVTLTDVFFMDSLNGWACGDSGTILNTSVAGLSWNRRATTVHSLLHHIQFPTLQYGIATGERGTVVQSSDSGMTWTALPGSDSGTASVVFFWIDHKRGHIVYNDNRRLLFTLDAGSTWQLFGISPRRIYGISGFRAMYTPNFFRVFYFDVGERGFVVWWYYCEDSLGQTCPAIGQIGQTTDTLAIGAVAIDRSDSSPLRLWAVGQKGWIISSIDTGKTWQTNTSPVQVNLNRLSFPLRALGFAVGDSGVILRYGTIVDVPEAIVTLPNQFRIFSPFPNPFNPRTSIELSLPSRERVVIAAYDMLGREVKRIIDEVRGPGKCRVAFDASDLSSGVYLIRVFAGPYSTATKVILMK